jgi:thiazole synthase/sulfur carrier protein
MTNTVGIFVNGEPREIPAGLTVYALLAHLGLPPNRLAIERNLNILPREAWAKTDVAAADRYEIVHLVGGG